MAETQVKIIPVEEYQALFRELLRDELKITLKPRQPIDLFEEELRILV